MTVSEHGQGRARTRGAAPRLALTQAEAAGSLGVSEDFFIEHIRPHVPVAYVGRRKLFPVKGLEIWLDREAARA